MLNLARNQFPVRYKMYLGQAEIIDDYGNKTGSYEAQYSDIRTTFLSVSPNKGTSETEMFGTIDDYDRTMTTSDISCEIDEDSVLWLDGHSEDLPYNYIVKKRAPWKNSIAYAIKKVKLSNE